METTFASIPRFSCSTGLLYDHFQRKLTVPRAADASMSSGYFWQPFGQDFTSLTGDRVANEVGVGSAAVHQLLRPLVVTSFGNVKLTYRLSYTKTA